MEITSARELVKSNELAVIVFTKGNLFSYDALGNGETGNWVVSKEILDQVNKVIVYMRDQNSGVNRIFLGTYAGYRQSPEANRQVIRFCRLTEIGTTISNWNEFANSGQNPVSYVGDFW